MAELVALETQSLEDENPGEDYVDFVATTTAALGVPSPCLSKRSSFSSSLRHPYQLMNPCTKVMNIFFLLKYRIISKCFLVYFKQIQIERIVWTTLKSCEEW